MVGLCILECFIASEEQHRKAEERRLHHEGESEAVEGAAAGVIEPMSTRPHLDKAQHLPKSLVNLCQHFDHLCFETRIRAAHAHITGHACDTLRMQQMSVSMITLAHVRPRQSG